MLFCKASQAVEWETVPPEPVTPAGEQNPLKALLRKAEEIHRRDSGTLLVLLGAVPHRESPAATTFAPLADMGFSGVILDSTAAAALPAPYQASRIGVLPGMRIGETPFQAYRLTGKRELEPPVRRGLWQRILRSLDLEKPCDGWSRTSLAGPAGAGKSHQLAALAVLLESRSHQVARANCLPSDVEGHFTPWRQILGELGNSDLGQSINRIGAELHLDAGLIGTITGFLASPGGENTVPLTPMQSRELLPVVLARHLAHLAEMQPIACVVDDIQWMDEASARVLGHLESARPPMRFLSGRRGQPAPDDFAVLPLTPAETRTFLEELTGQARIGDDFNREIHHISGGIPLLIREVIHLLRQRGSLMKTGKTLDLKPGVDLRHRDGAENGMVGIGDRLQQIQPALRNLLGACSLWRDPFTRTQAGVICEACFPGIPFAELWNSQETGDFIVPLPGSGNRFMFYHDLLREAALGTLPEERRAACHRAALEWLENNGKARAFPEQAAHHARAAGLRDEAIRYYDEASAAALSRFALREARRTTKAAWELDEWVDGDAACRARQARRNQVAGEMEFHSGEMAKAEKLLERSLRLYFQGTRPLLPWAVVSGAVRQLRLWFSAGTGGRCRGQAETAAAARAALMLAEIAYFQNRQRLSSRRCLIALDLASKNGDSPFLASLCAAIACPLSGRRPHFIARRYLAIADGMIARVGDAVEATYTGHVSCLAHLGAADWTNAAAKASKSADFWRSHGHGRREEEACLFAFYADYFRGRLGEAAAWAERLESASTKRSDAQSQLWAITLRTLVAISQGSADEAGDICRSENEPEGDVLTRHGIEVLRARCAWHRAAPWQALEHLKIAGRLDGGEPPVSATQFLMAETAMLLGEMAAFAPADLRQDADFQSLVARLGRRADRFARVFPFGKPRALCGRALMLFRSDPAKSSRLFSAAMRNASRLGMALDSARVRCLAARVLDDGASLRSGIQQLTACGATAEIRHLQQLAQFHE